MRAPRLGCLAVLNVCAIVTLSGCASGSPGDSDPPTASSTQSPATTTSIAGPTLIVTVPELVSEDASAPAPVGSPAGDRPVQTSAAGTSAAAPAPTAASGLPADAPAPAIPPRTAPAAPPGAGLNVSLANCDGCTVLATHRAVTGDLSAALVGTGSGRAILLSVAGDGRVSGVIGVPYGAAFAMPAGGVLACAQARCVVQGRQNDGRAILSAFELTGTGAWRDVSGDDAFPSATEQAAVIDLDGDVAIAVQDQGNGAAVWMLYTWGGERYAVVGCAADGAAPTMVSAVSRSVCLS